MSDRSDSGSGGSALPQSFGDTPASGASISSQFGARVSGEDRTQSAAFTDALYPSGGAAGPQTGENGDPDRAGGSSAAAEAANEYSVTETTNVSWFQKLTEAALGVVIGMVLVAITAALLFWNEGRAVQTARSLTEGAGLVVDVESGRIDAANEGRLVHVQGDLSTGTPLVDPSLGVQARAARLVRTVEMYQWKEESRTETHKKVGGGEERVTTYTYSRVWSDRRIESERFHNQSGHANPQMRYSKTEMVARDASLGAFRPGPGALAQLAAGSVHGVEDADAARLRARPGMGPVQAVNGQLYLGSDPGNPRVGDVRVTYQVAPLGPTSFIGRQTGADLTEYQTRAGDRLLLARSGLVPADAMFARAQQENVGLTWILRLISTIFMFVGFVLILRPIAVVGDIVPIVGTMLGAGTSLVAGLLTAVLAPLVIAVAWLFYRPLVAALILAGGLAVAFGLRRLARRRRSSGSVPGPGGAAATPAR